MELEYAGGAMQCHRCSGQRCIIFLNLWWEEKLSEYSNFRG